MKENYLSMFTIRDVDVCMYDADNWSSKKVSSFSYHLFAFFKHQLKSSEKEAHLGEGSMNISRLVLVNVPNLELNLYLNDLLICER